MVPIEIFSDSDSKFTPYHSETVSPFAEELTVSLNPHNNHFRAVFAFTATLDPSVIIFFITALSPRFSKAVTGSL